LAAGGDAAEALVVAEVVAEVEALVVGALALNSLANRASNRRVRMFKHTLRSPLLRLAIHSSLGFLARLSYQASCALKNVYMYW